jgi:predicted nuclease of predicted toxin-antitoxin system
MVPQEGLSGAADERVLDAAVSEGRVLVTIDHDFANTLRYPPDRTAGIAVLNPPGRVSRGLLQALVEALIVAMEQKAIHGKLWIVEPSRIREHQPEHGTEHRKGGER